MVCHDDLVMEDELTDSSRKIIMHPLYQPKLSPWFDLRVFYVKLSNCEVEESAPEHLTLNHIPLSPDTILEVNGRRSSIHSECVSSLLRRDRVDKNSEEATFVSTDSIRMTGSVRFEVYDRDALLLSGVLELRNGNGFVGESKNYSKKWTMKCQSMVPASSVILKGNQYTSPEMPLPIIEVFVAGSFSGTPIVLTEILQLGFQNKHHKKVVLDSIPEYETSEMKKEASPEVPLQVSEYQGYILRNDSDIDYNSIYSRAEYIEGEEGELSWFNAGVRVGVGIGLGICLGLGIGVGLMVRTYQATTRNFKRRLV